MTGDPFPSDRVRALLGRLGRYGRLAWRLAREPLLSRARRSAILAAAAYLASPIDAVPGVIPVLGQLDDVAVALVAIRFALAGLDGERRRAHLDAVGLTDDDLASDLATLGATGAWLARAGARLGVRVTRVGARVGARVGGRVIARGSRLAASGLGRVGEAASHDVLPAVRRSLEGSRPGRPWRGRHPTAPGTGGAGP